MEFLGWLSDEEVRRLYQGSQAVLMPGVEDFGLVPVEAQACGRPVVALAEGGALESVIDGETGVLVADDSVEAFADALGAVSSRAVRFRRDPPACRTILHGPLQAAVCRHRERQPGVTDPEEAL